MTALGAIIVVAFFTVMVALVLAALADLLLNLPVRVWVRCRDCRGRGVVDRDTSNPRRCRACRGRGRVEDHVDTGSGAS
ncbi:hypothetical protein [Nocardia brasiliensis]|uniref:hypothetical protein n=1 Tax=Nocardia brasiliensis TaxID=37326 RepID=UPI0033C88D34